MPRMMMRPRRGCTYWAYSEDTVMLTFTPVAAERLAMRSEVSMSVTKRSAATPLAKRTLAAITARLTSARSPVSAEASTELLRKVAVGQLKAVAGHVTELCSATAASSLSGPVVALRTSPLATKDRSTWRLRKW